jgi:DNA-binding response OmpR family regulator
MSSAEAARVAIVADDLIWSTRLVDAVRAAGAEPVPMRALAAPLADGDAAFRDIDAVIVDLTARAYDGVAVVASAAAAGRAVIAVGQHDDQQLRRRALDAGAERVYAYRKLFEDGPRTIGTWLAGVRPTDDGTAGRAADTAAS